MTNEPGMFDFDRERGIFTPRDRRFLTGELDDDLSDVARRQKRYRLRKRMAHALQDLAYLQRMDTRDVGQLVDGLQAEMWDTNGDDQRPTQTLERLYSALFEILGVFRESMAPETFDMAVTRHIALREVLDHYEETGEYKRVNASVDVEEIERMSISELLERGDKSDFGSIQSPLTRFVGGWEVLDLHFDEHPLHHIETAFPSDPEDSDAAAVLDAIQELSSDDVAPLRDRVERLVAEKEDLSREEAHDAVQEALFAGLCYEPTDTRLRAT